jgi:hypothetical protein
MAKIMEVMANFLRATMAKACRSSWPHMEAVLNAGCDFFK